MARPRRLIRMTEAQHHALKWLYDHGGSGEFGECGTFIAQGKMAPVLRSTWMRLYGLGLLNWETRNKLVFTKLGLEQLPYETRN